MAKLVGSFGVRVSCLDMDGWKLGVVKYDSLRIICVETLCENCSTCFLIYRRNASLNHLPIIMMVKVGTLARYIAMADPDLIECVPISTGSKPKSSFPTRWPADCNFIQTVLDVMVRSLPLTRMVLTVVSAFVPG